MDTTGDVAIACKVQREGGLVGDRTTATENTEGSNESIETDNVIDPPITADVVEPVVEKIETAEEKLERIRAFYDTELSRPELECKGPPIKWTLLTCQEYYQQQWYGNRGQGEGAYYNGQSRSSQVAEDPKDAKIAEYFGEELNREEDNETEPRQEREESEGSRSGRGDSDSKYRGSMNRTNSTIGVIHEEPEVEETIDSTGGNEAEKASKRSKKKGGIVTSTKVMIRHLPRNLRKQEFLDVLGPIPDHTFLYFCSGYFLSKVAGKRSTGYCSINFSQQEDADMFINNYRFFVLRDEKGNDHFVSTDFAISQRIPKVSNSVAMRQTDIYDLEKDSRYQQFKKKYEASPGVLGKEVNPDGTVTADTLLKEIEEKGTKKDNSQLTPLLEFLIKKANVDSESRRLKREKLRETERVKAATRKEKKREQRREKNKAKDKELQTKDKGSSGHVVDGVELIRRNKPESAPSDSNNVRSGRQDASTRNSQPKKTGDRLASSDTKEPRKDQKERNAADTPNKSRRGERRSGDKRHTGPKAKSEAPAAEVESKTPKKPVKVERKETNPETTTAAGANVENSLPEKKKVVKKIVKVKRIVKSTSSDTVGAEEPRASSKPVEARKPHSDVPKEPNASLRVSSETSDNDKNAEGKRKRSRPDIQIYRPGSLRSGQGSGPSRSSGQDKSVGDKRNSGSSKQTVKEPVKEKSAESK